jgi:signal transduction histidine kinase
VYYKLFNTIKFTAIFFFAGICFADVYGQDSRVIDSLKVFLESQDQKQRVDALIGLALEYFDVNNQLAYDYSNQALQLSSVRSDSAQIVKSARICGQLLRRLDRLEESIEVLKSVQRSAKRNNYIEDYKRILNALAINYTFIGDYDEALRYHFESLILREKEGDKEGMSVALNNIGLVYFKLHNDEQALDYYKRAIKIKRETGSDGLDPMLLNAGLANNGLGRYSEASEIFKEALDICAKKGCSTDTRVGGLYGLGIASMYGSKKFDEAEKNFEESYKLAKESGDKRYQIENLLSLVRIHTNRKDGERARQLLQEAESIAAGTEYNELLINIYGEFARVFNEIKDFQNAAIYQQKYIALKDSVYDQELIKNLAKVQAQYEERENLATITTKEEIIQRQRSLNVAIVIIAVLLGLLIFVLYRSNHTKKKVNQALSDAKAIIEDQNKQLLSSNYSLDKELKEKNIDLEKANESLQRVNEELDNFIYKTSHDIRGPLASLKGMCNVAIMDVKDTLALNYLRKLDITAEKLNTILTRLLIVNQINNSTLAAERIDFQSIVSDVLLLENKKGLPPRLTIRKQIDDSVSYYSDKEFVRIILENLIDNAIKFYNDSDRIEPFVDISVTEQGDNVKIKVVDNGIGISQVHPDKIFQMFSRASERSETGGIGYILPKQQPKN